LGVPMLKGLSPYSRNCLFHGFWFDTFGPESHSSDTDEQSLCAYAWSKKINKIYVLNDLRDPGKNKLLTCAP
jgi:hypothetical protein